MIIKKIVPKVGWFFIGLTILVLLIFAAIRVVETYSGVPTADLFKARYIQHQIVSAIHMFTGIAFVLFAPLQFITKFRNKNLRLHRILGRVLVSFALIAGIYGMVSAVVLPAFGGITTETAVWFFGPIFIFSIARAFWCIRKRKIAQHREWMIRAFALGIGVGTQRIVVGLFIGFGGYPMVEIFGTALWLGFGLNLLVAEIWINLSRKTK